MPGQRSTTSISQASGGNAAPICVLQATEGKANAMYQVAGSLYIRLYRVRTDHQLWMNGGTHKGRLLPLGSSEDSIRSGHDFVPDASLSVALCKSAQLDRESRISPWSLLFLSTRSRRLIRTAKTVSQLAVALSHLAYGKLHNERLT